MKTRSGFVSNSSSSSFCILGVEMTDEMERRVEIGRAEKLKNTRVHVEYAISGGEGKYVGISAASIKDDETPRQVKRELIDALHSIGVDVGIDKVGWIQDGGYNG